MEFPFAVLEPPLARPSPVPTGMMQSQALATLVIIRQIVQPACDLAHTPHISRNRGCRSHHSVASQPSSASPKSVMAGEYLVGIRLSRRPLRADTQPFFLPLGQNSTLYVKETSNIHWEDRVLSLISIKLIRVVMLS